jgi:biopolymer transport protein ExbB
MDLILLQVVDTLATDAGQAVTMEKTSWLDLLQKGGLLMIPMALLSLIAVYIFVERYLTIRKATQIDQNFMNNIKDNVMSGNVSAAKDLCLRTDSPIARMIEKGLMRLGKPLKNIDVAIENVGKLEIFKLEKSLSTLATISGAAPMIGFLGTVIGMIKAFFNMAKAGNNIDPSMLAGGIYEAMITTAAGLAVGILAYIAYNLLVSMVSKVVFKMEATSVEFVDLLQEPSS